ncbi:hypothetical protein B1H18_22680 [Streptomyces tsukubensis]|uniref:Peptidase n=1 Tax=Streptomyces tsukubensis TaxID=83656 RepID=A0A1V4A4B3_9ACTN|nr:hypothetical protein B1H18_22680 [Streptomyces tsukubensis]
MAAAVVAAVAMGLGPTVAQAAGGTHAPAADGETAAGAAGSAAAPEGDGKPDRPWATIDAEGQSALPAGEPGARGKTVPSLAGYSFHDGGDFFPAPRNVVFRIDVSDLKGVAAVKVTNDRCTRNSAVITCPDDGALHAPEHPFGLAAAEGAKAGAHGTITYEVTADRATGDRSTAEVTVGAPELHVGALPSKTGLRPGDAVALPVVLRNTGDLPTERTVVAIEGGPGVAYAKKYRNCQYLSGDYGTLSSVRCVFDDTVRPGASVAFSSPLAGSLTKDAFHSWTEYSAEPVAPGTGTDTGGERGSGPELRLTPTHAGEEFADRRQVTYEASNSADFRAVGATLKPGARGHKAQLTFGLVNEGPATVADREGLPVASVDVRLPEGVVATDVYVDEEPDFDADGNCRTYVNPTTTKPFEPGHRHYVCPDAPSETNGDGQEFRFTVRYDEDIAEGASGEVTLLPGGVALNDPDQSNDTAPLSVGDPTSSPTPSPSPTPSASAPASASAGTGAQRTTAPAGPHSSPAVPAEGPMADTGAPGYLPWLTAGAVVAVGVGAITFAVARRRPSD